MRARNWWRMAVDAIRRTLTLPAATRRFLARVSLGLPQNHPSRAWKQAVARPPRVQVPDDRPSWSVPGGLGRSMRARNWWRMAVDAIRRTFTLPGADRRRVARISRGLRPNHPSKAWKNVVARPPPVDDGDPDNSSPYWNDFFRHVPGGWGRNSNRLTDAQDVIGFHLHPYRRPTENDEDFWPYTRNFYDPQR